MIIFVDGQSRRHSRFQQGMQIEATTGHHLLCTLVHTGLDDAGRSHSLHFATTERGREVKLRFNSNLAVQLQDMDACFKVVEMDDRGADCAVVEVVTSFTRSPGEQLKDRHRRVLNAIWSYVWGK